MASLRCHTRAEVETSMAQAVQTFLGWRDVPAPQHSVVLRLFGETLRAHKELLARLVTLEAAWDGSARYREWSRFQG